MSFSAEDQYFQLDKSATNLSVREVGSRHKKGE